MKDAIIAKLANQAADYFGDAFKQCQYKDTLPKVSYCSWKHCSFACENIWEYFCVWEASWYLQDDTKKFKILGEAFQEDTEIPFYLSCMTSYFLFRGYLCSILH